MGDLPYCTAGEATPLRVIAGCFFLRGPTENLESNTDLRGKKKLRNIHINQIFRISISVPFLVVKSVWQSGHVFTAVDDLF